jgi:hypothetical protein
MKYFSNLPTIDYLPGNLTNSTKMKNIFITLNVILSDQDIYTELYRIEGIKRLDTISYELYKKTDYWWLIARINNIKDIIFDMPLDEEILHLIAKDRTKIVFGSEVILSENLDAMDYYIEQVQELIIENDEKRTIKVIKPAYIGAVLTAIIKSL